MSEHLYVRDLRKRHVLPLGEEHRAPTVTMREPGMEELARLYRVYADAFSTRPGPLLTEEAWTTAWPQHRMYAPHLSVVALQHELPVGYLLAYVDPELPDEGYIGQVGVLHTQQGKGIGTALIVRAMKTFTAEGFARAALRVALDNPQAIALYERLGFTPSV